MHIQMSSNGQYFLLFDLLDNHKQQMQTYNYLTFSPNHVKPLSQE